MKKTLYLAVVILLGCQSSEPESASEAKAPVAVDDKASTRVNTSVDIPVKENDRDDDSQMANVNIIDISVPTSGTAQVVGDKINFIPEANFTGDVSFTYTLEDPDKNQATANVVVSVTSDENQKPSVTDDSFTVTVAEETVFDVLVNDSDPEGYALSITDITPSTIGVLSIENNKIVFKAGNTPGEEVVVYTVQDNSGAASTGKITLVIKDNSAPLARKDFLNLPVTQELRFNPLANDRDPEGQPLKLVHVHTEDSRLFVEIENDHSIRLKAKENFEETVKVVYSVEDSSGKRTDSSISVRVYPDTTPVFQLSASDIEDGEFTAQQATYIQSTAGRYEKTRIHSDANSDEFSDISFALSGIKIDSKTVEANFILHGQEGGLGKQVSVQELLTGDQSRVNGKVVYARFKELLGTHYQTDLNADGYPDYVFNRSFGIDVYFGKANEPRLLDVESELVTFSSGGTEVGSISDVDMMDVNGDGKDDLIVVPKTHNRDHQELRIYYGPITTQDVDLFSRELNPTQGLIITGFSQYKNSNTAIVYQMTDLNGDGKKELVVGDVLATNEQSQAVGRVTILWETSSLPATIDMSGTLDKLVTTKIQFDTDVDLTIGKFLESTDVDNDGRQELLLGVAKPTSLSIRSYVELRVLGSESEWPATVNLSDLPVEMTMQRIYMDSFTGSEDRLRGITSTDINGDNYGDIVIEHLLTSYILLGSSANRPSEINLNEDVLDWPHVTINKTDLVEYIGSMNLNNDEFMDLLVTQKNSSKMEAFVLYGGYQYNVIH